MVKVITISQYGCKTDADPTKWVNYDKNYDGYKLVKGEDEGKEVELLTNGGGYITGVKLGDLGMTEPKETEVMKAGTPVKNGSLAVKVITSTEPDIFQDELNTFASKYSVKFTQTHVFGNYLLAVVFYEN